MTLVIAAQGQDVVVLGCDSRGMIEDAAKTKVALDRQQKLVQLTDTAGILLYGSAYRANYFLETYKQQMKGNLKYVTAIAENFAQFCRSQLRLIGDICPDYNPIFGFIIAGVDTKNSQTIPKCFCLDNKTGFQLGMSKHGFDIAGKIILPNYIFAKKYNNGMDVDQLTDLVLYTINDTMQNDGDVGGKISMAIIDSVGMRMVRAEDIEEKVHRLDQFELG